MSRLAGRFSLWMNRLLDSGDRYICGCCDERFSGRATGISHVIACHPEFADTVAKEPRDHEWTPVSEPVAVRPLGATPPLLPVWG